MKNGKRVSTLFRYTIHNFLKIEEEIEKKTESSSYPIINCYFHVCFQKHKPCVENAGHWNTNFRMFHQKESVETLFF